MKPCIPVNNFLVMMEHFPGLNEHSVLLMRQHLAGGGGGGGGVMYVNQGYFLY